VGRTVGSETATLLREIAYFLSCAYFVILHFLDIRLSASGQDIYLLSDCNTLNSGFPLCPRRCNGDEGGGFKQREHTV
jgi:hypothetical protein